MSHSNTTLRQVVQRVGPLEFKRAAQYAQEVARQLAQLHHVGRLHNDVRPGNVFLGESGAAQLGPPAPLNETEPNDDIETISEQVDCLALERALNGPEIDGQADIYSLGCTFYFLLTGQAAFPHGTIAERLLMHQSAKPQAITQFRTDAPRRLIDMCEKMMAKKPDDRYQSAEEVAKTIAAWRASTQ